jgi:arylsulfatase
MKKRPYFCLLFAPFMLIFIDISGQKMKSKSSQADQLHTKPNIIIIMTDDVGYWNVGAYSRGMMVPTPNIDRIANEGMLFTDHYSQPTCTPGRAMLITGQLPIRTGLTTVGMAGSP